MRSAMTQLNLSAWAYHRILKLAGTIADLARSEEIQSVHLAEALQYRSKLIISNSALIYSLVNIQLFPCLLLEH
jgi:predicted ATPase with chaperone activity